VAKDQKRAKTGTFSVFEGKGNDVAAEHEKTRHFRRVFSCSKDGNGEGTSTHTKHALYGVFHVCGCIG